MPDADVAARANINWSTARNERRRRGIAPFKKRSRSVTWTEDMVALLGTDTDSEVAKILGLSADPVSYRRRLLGIPAYGASKGPRSRLRWPPRMVALLGTASDSVVAKRLGLTREVVWWKRRQLGIASFRPAFLPVVWPKAVLRTLGRRRDTEIARQLGIRPQTVLMKREELGIPPFQAGRPVVRPKNLKALLRLPNRVLVHEHGLTNSLISRLRREYGIGAPGRPRDRWTPDVLARLGRVPDTVIARDLGVATPSVLSKRRTLGIAALSDARWRGRRKTRPQLKKQPRRDQISR